MSVRALLVDYDIKKQPFHITFQTSVSFSWNESRVCSNDLCLRLGIPKYIKHQNTFYKPNIDSINITYITGLTVENRNINCHLQWVSCLSLFGFNKPPKSTDSSKGPCPWTSMPRTAASLSPCRSLAVAACCSAPPAVNICSPAPHINRSWTVQSPTPGLQLIHELHWTPTSPGKVYSLWGARSGAHTSSHLLGELAAIKRGKQWCKATELGIRVSTAVLRSGDQRKELIEVRG